jgi:uncharacterized protein
MAVTTLTPIDQIQGDGLFSPLVGQSVRVRGVVTGRSNRGFFVQDPDRAPNATGSSAVFVAALGGQVAGLKLFGALVELEGTVLDFVKDEDDKPTTQLQLEWVSIIASSDDAPDLPVVWLGADNLPEDNIALAKFLNAHEFMLVGIKGGAIFSAPSNPYGDYVVLPKNMKVPRSIYGSAILDAANPERWYPGFRVTRSDLAPRVNVGDRLSNDVMGPLNYRVGSYQIMATNPIQVERRPLQVESKASKVPAEYVSILTLNAFNLDPHIEDRERVQDPDTDIDDDVGDGRFEMLARVIVEDAHSPAIVALQEIQDNDGAEITDVADAATTFETLIADVKILGGPSYAWIDLAPANGEDGGQPGGNIRNGYLYDPARIEVVPNSLLRIGENDAAYEGSRKALKAEFIIKASQKRLAVINVHLASKRHQHSIFAPKDPGFDPREATRIAQAEIIRRHLIEFNAQSLDYYVTGDFNDFEFSESVKALLGDESVNLVHQVPVDQRFDYNHRGKLHTLMQGIISKRLLARGGNGFEIMHGSDLLGVQPGSRGERATDHAYVVAHLKL